MIRRNFITTAISGLAWLCGVRSQSEEWWRFSEIPKLGSRHPSIGVKALTRKYYQLDDYVWKVEVEYENEVVEYGHAFGTTAKDVHDRNQWIQRA